MNFKIPERKRFATWTWIKRDIHGSGHKPPFFREGEVWWCYSGENVGVEINGKGERFTRPILIFRKYDRYSFLGLPLSTQEKVGTWYVQVSLKGISQNINLVQGKVLDYKRLKEKFGQIDESEFYKIRRKYIDLHSLPDKNRPLTIAGESRG